MDMAKTEMLVSERKLEVVEKMEDQIDKKIDKKQSLKNLAFYTRELLNISEDVGENVKNKPKKETEEEERKSGDVEEEMTEESFVLAMDQYREKKTVNFQNERKQELFEKELNTRLIKISDLEQAVRAGEDGVFETELPYEDKNIRIFDVYGKNLCFLQHTVDYRLSPDNSHDSNGYQKSEQLIQNPSFWLENKKMNENSNTLSLSYIDTDINIMHGGAMSYLGVTYGFSRVEPDTIIGVYNEDGYTSNDIGEIMSREGEFLEDSLDSLAKHSTISYNEVLMRRYDEAGRTVMPDFLVTYDNGISEETLRHASFFNVPIINIAREPYLEKQQAIIEKRVDGLDKDSDIEEIKTVLKELKETSLDINLLSLIESGDLKMIDGFFERNFSLNRFSETTKEKMRWMVDRVFNSN